MSLPDYIAERLNGLEQPNREAIAQSMRRAYELPVDFWKSFLGKDLHYHLGHFATPEDDLDNAMRTAVRALASLGPTLHQLRVLDVGCGWGGPAMELLKEHGCSLDCLTTSSVQANYTRTKLATIGVKVHVGDVERGQLPLSQPIDVAWLYESFEHMVNPRRVLTTLRKHISNNGMLLMGLSCLRKHSDKPVFNHDLGIQPLLSVDEIQELLKATGWSLSTIVDHTASTLPVWRKWRDNLESNLPSAYEEQGSRFIRQFEIAESLYRNDVLCSIHLKAT